MNLGEKIRVARKTACLTQDQLAKRLGCAAITVRQYELGKRQPNLEQLSKISDELEVPILYLIGKQEGSDDIESARREYQESRKSCSLENAVESIIESLYGTKRTENVRGTWASTNMTVFGEAGNEIYLSDDAMAAVVNAVNGVVSSIVDALKEDANAARAEIICDLSSDHVREQIEHFESQHEAPKKLEK